MKQNLKAIFLLFGVAFFAVVACQEEAGHKVNVQKYSNLGDSISLEAQGALLTHLSQAIADSGFAYAIEYCNLYANELTNSVLDNKKVMSIQRLSDRNRNEENALKTDDDKAIFARFANNLTDTITVQGQLITYYKPIKIMMPTCLNCHGKRDNMTEEVLHVLETKYPNDRAIDYSEGELRGMWKVVMQ